MFRLQRLLSTADLGEDVGGSGGPDEGLGVPVVLGEVAMDGDLQVGNALEDTAADALAGDLGEEALDEIEPGRRGWSEVQVEPSAIPSFLTGKPDAGTLGGRTATHQLLPRMRKPREPWSRQARRSKLTWQ